MEMEIMLICTGFFIMLFGSVAAFIAMIAITNMSPYYDFEDGFSRFMEMMFYKEKPEIPKSLEPMLNAPNNRDFVIEMLKLRKETIKKYGYDPFCSLETDEEIVAAEKVAAALECLVNKYPDPDGFNRALNSTGLINYVTKFNNNKEN